jgi:hypothetical protein
MMNPAGLINPVLIRSAVAASGTLFSFNKKLPSPKESDRVTVADGM